jgi:hypothetical protein
MRASFPHANLIADVHYLAQPVYPLFKVVPDRHDEEWMTGDAK